MNRHEMQELVAATTNHKQRIATRRNVYEMIPGLAQTGDGKLQEQYQVIRRYIDSEGSTAWQAIETELLRETVGVYTDRATAEDVLARLKTRGSGIVGWCVKGGGGDVCARFECPPPSGQYVGITYSQAIRDSNQAGDPNYYTCENCGRPFVGEGDDDATE